jgi:hypothetical protein
VSMAVYTACLTVEVKLVFLYTHLLNRNAMLNAPGYHVEPSLLSVPQNNPQIIFFPSHSGGPFGS